MAALDAVAAAHAGATVLVHADEHWLIRDLALQPAGPRIASGGTRCVKRMDKRKADDGGWETIDHATCKVRKVVAASSESESDQDE